jgi:hypothetical protein
VILDPAKLPAGAVAQIGAARFVAAESLHELVVRRDGSIVGTGFQHARIWRANGEPIWSVRTNAETLHAVAADVADVFVVLDRHHTYATLRVLDAALRVHGPTFELGSVRNLAISARGTRVLALGSTVAALEVATGTKVITPTPVVAVAGWVDDAGGAVVVAGDQILRWSGVKGEAPVAIATLPSRARHAAFTPSGASLAWTTGDRVGVVDLTTGASVMDALSSDADVVRVTISSDGGQVASSSKGKIAVWDAGTGKVAWGHDASRSAAPAVAFSLDGDVLVSEVSRVVRFSRTGERRPTPDETRFVDFDVGGAVILTHAGRTVGIDLVTMKEVTPGPRLEEPVPANAPEWADRAGVAIGGGVTAWSDDAISECAPMQVWRADGTIWTTPKPRDCTADVIVGPWAPGPGMVADTTGADPIVFDAALERAVLTIEARRRTLVGLAGSPDLDLVVAVFERHGRGADPDDNLDPEEAVGRPVAAFDLEVWSRATARLLAASEVPPERGILADLLVRRDGLAAYLGWVDGTIDELSLPSAAVRTLGRERAGIRLIEQSPTSQHIVTTADDRRTTIWLP